jgi:hypothetical protein
MRSRSPIARALALLLCTVLLGAPVAAGAKVYLSQKEAIELAFPDADRVERQTLMLSQAQAGAIEKLALAKLDSRLVTVYTGTREGRLLGYALIDIHNVRTLPEAVMVVLSPAGEVRSLRMLAFHEPEEYRPPDRWLAQFESQQLDPELRLHGRVHGIAGSTLSSRAVTSGVRRALALWEVMLKPEAPAGEPAVAEDVAGASLEAGL